MTNSCSINKFARLEMRHSKNPHEKAQNKRERETQRLMTMDDHFLLLQKSPPSESQPKPLTKFSIFGNLPTELRLKVWEWAVRDLGGRIVALNIITGMKRVRTRITCQRPHPSISFTCREARMMTLETLGPFFQAGTPHDLVSTDIEKDTIVLGTTWGRKHIKHFIKAVGEDKAKKLKHLAIEYERTPKDHRRAVATYRIHTDPRHTRRTDEYEIYELPNCFNGLREIYDTFPALKTLVFIPHADGERDGSHRSVGELIFEKRHYEVVNETLEYRKQTYNGWAAWKVEIMWRDLSRSHVAWAGVYFPQPTVREMRPQIDFLQLGIKGKTKTKCLTAKGEVFRAII